MTDIRWNPSDYAANSSAQEACARELMDRLHLRGDEHILDVGCGDGRVTAELARRVPRGRVVGVDASAEMIRHAKQVQSPGGPSHLEFHAMDARCLAWPARFDVVFSNAVLHWVDDQRAFLRGAAAALKPGGRLVLAAGGKGNAAEVFAALRSVMRQAPWRAWFRRLSVPYFFHEPEVYRRWLMEAGFHEIHVALVPGRVAYAGPAGLAAWLRTTWLPYTQRVPVDRREAFIAEVVARYVARQPPDGSGNVLVDIVRLEIEAVRR